MDEMNECMDEWMNEFCDPAATSAPSIDFGFLLHCCWIMWIVCLSALFKGHPVERAEE
jgi:hypothetical protein